MIEPENQTTCPDTESGKHEWYWYAEDYKCDECGVLESQQENV